MSLDAVIDLMTRIGDNPVALSEAARDVIKNGAVLYLMADPDSIDETYQRVLRQRAAKALFRGLSEYEDSFSFGEIEGKDGPIAPTYFDGWHVLGDHANEIRFDDWFDSPDEDDPEYPNWSKKLDEVVLAGARAPRYRNVRIDRKWLEGWIKGQLTYRKVSIAALTAAKKAATQILKTDPNIPKTELEKQLRANEHSFSHMGFIKTIWPESRMEAGLPKMGKAGAKSKQNRTG